MFRYQKARKRRLGGELDTQQNKNNIVRISLISLRCKIVSQEIGNSRCYNELIDYSWKTQFYTHQLPGKLFTIL